MRMPALVERRCVSALPGIDRRGANVPVMMAVGAVLAYGMCVGVIVRTRRVRMLNRDRERVLAPRQRVQPMSADGDHSERGQQQPNARFAEAGGHEPDLGGSRFCNSTAFTSSDYLKSKAPCQEA